MNSRHGPFRRAGLIGVLATGLVLALAAPGFAFGAEVPKLPSTLNPIVMALAPSDPIAIPVQGADRYLTAVEASKKFGSAQNVVIATGAAFPDALGGAALAGAVKGPLLLTPTASVPQAVLDEIVRLGATKAYVLGGTGAVSDAALAQIDALPNVAVERVAGATRYATANAVAAKTISILGAGYEGKAFMATGLNFPDALASSPLMYAQGMPLILVDASGNYTLPAQVTKVTILGGTGAVPASVEPALGTKFDRRIAGATRYATSVAVAEYGVSLGMTWDNLGLATGESFPDALCAGPLLGSRNSVLLLSTSTSLAGDSATALGAHKGDVYQYYLFGGVGTLSTDVRAQVAAILAVVPGSHVLPEVSCTVSGCHDTKDSASIHMAVGCQVCHAPTLRPTNDCISCHGEVEDAHDVVADHAGIVSAPADPTEACGSCHDYTTALAVHASCDVCHASTDAVVVNAIKAGDAKCETCHSFATVHEDGVLSHSVTGDDCYSSTCHGTDVVLMHTTDFRGSGETPPGCDACHGTGITPTTNCLACHQNIAAAHNASTAHATFQSGVAGTRSSACVACHGTNLMDVSAGSTHLAGEHVGCSCHARREVTPAVTECIDCHEDSYAPHGFANGVSPHHEESWVAASGHNTTTFGTIGAKTKFDGSQGVTLHWEAERSWASLPGTWSVEAGFQEATAPDGWMGSAVTTGTTGVVTTDWEFPAVNVFWEAGDAAAPADAMFLNETSVVTCENCHTGLEAAGPHGADQQWGLDTDYPADYSYAELTKNVETYPSGIKVRSTLTTATQTYTSGMGVICSKCHDLQNYQSGTTVNNPLPRISTGDATFDFASDTWDPVYVDTAVSRYRGYYVWTRNDGTQVDPATITITGVGGGAHDQTWSSTDPQAQAWIQGAAGTTTAATIGSSNTAHSSHHQDATDGSAQCVNCHIGIPHGWKRPRLLVNSGWSGTANAIGAGMIEGDRAPYRDPDLLGTTAGVSGGTILANPATGFNGMGMLTLSAVDNHYLWASSSTAKPDSERYYTGAAYWSEASCQACNDHAGEDGIRIIDHE